MPIEPEPGDFIRAHRERAGLTQRELAERAGISQAVVSRIEKGRQLPTLDQIDRVLDVLGLMLRLESVPAWAAIDEAVEQARSVEEVFIEAEDRLYLPGGFHIRRIKGSLDQAGIDFRFSGLTAAALLGAPVPVSACDLMVTDSAETLDAFDLWLCRAEASRWSDRWQEYGFDIVDPRVPGAMRWMTILGELTLQTATTLPPAVAVEFCGERLPVIGLADIEVADRQVARVLDRLRALRASGAENSSQGDVSGDGLGRSRRRGLR
jgi:transcriptional regulator with XRE-family HTH domain